MSNNKGIVISGGQLTANQIAVGDCAKIVNYGPKEQAQVLEKIDSLISAIYASNSSAENRKSMVAAADAIKVEANKSKPDTKQMESHLSLIEKVGTSVSGVASAVKAVSEVIAMFMGA